MLASMTYLRLLFNRAAAESRLGDGRLFAMIVRFLVFLVLCSRGIWLLLSPRPVDSIPGWASQIAQGRFLILTVALASLTAALGLTVFSALPKLPYLRFWSRAAWFARSWFYPVLSLNTIWLGLLFIGIFGLRGTAYFTCFYFVNILGQRQLGASLMTVAAATGAAYWGGGEIIVGTVIGVCLLAGFLWVWRLDRRGSSVFPMTIPRKVSFFSVNQRKEVGYYRAYTFDTVHLLLALALWAYFTYSLVARPEVLSRTFGLEVAVMLSILPFSRVLLNFMGMDSNALRRLVTDPPALVKYELTRVRGYSLISYGLVGAIVLVRLVSGDSSFTPTLAIASVACIELTLMAGVFLSIHLYEEKEVGYHYGQSLRSRSIHTSLATLLAIGILTYAVRTLGGIFSVSALAMGALYINTQLLPRTAVLALEGRRDHLIRRT